MNVSQIAMGYVLGKIYILSFKVCTVLFIPIWIMSFLLFFTFTYSPNDAEIKHYPPILSSKVIQTTTSHLRYNFRVVLGTFVPVKTDYFKDMSKAQISNFPKEKDAIFQLGKIGMFERISIQIPMIQRQSVMIYNHFMTEVLGLFKDKPINNLDWTFSKK